MRSDGVYAEAPSQRTDHGVSCRTCGSHAVIEIPGTDYPQTVLTGWFLRRITYYICTFCGDTRKKLHAPEADE